jgi:cytochrome c oxidase cbb3-type subunit 4
MDTYTLLREIADSWVLLAMTLFFLGVIGWVLRPGSSKIYRDTANIPFRNDTKGCANACPDCTCAGSKAKEAQP